MWPLIYSSLYGRFLLLQLESVGSVVVLNFMFACFHIAAQLDGRGADSWWLSLVYGERAKDAMQSTKDVDEMELVNQLAGSMMEASSIVAASALLSLGGVATSPGVPPDQTLIWFNAAIQLLTTLVFNFVEVTACGKFNNLEWGRVYPKSVRRFLSYVMIEVTLGGSRCVGWFAGCVCWTQCARRSQRVPPSPPPGCAWSCCCCSVPGPTTSTASCWSSATGRRCSRPSARRWARAGAGRRTRRPGSQPSTSTAPGWPLSDAWKSEGGCMWPPGGLGWRVGGLEGPACPRV